MDCNDGIKLTALTKIFDTKIVIENLNLTIARGDMIGIFAPNGCGKTTLLNLLAGIEKCSDGEIEFSGQPLKFYKIGFLFQDYYNYLLPWKTAKDNIVLPLKLMHVSGLERGKKLNDLLTKIGDLDFPLCAYPYELSGGQRQFISLLRCLIECNDILLLDEPFSSLDYNKRAGARKMLINYWQNYRPTILFVTHDLHEAILVSNKILVFKKRPINNDFLFLKIDLPYPREEKLFNTSEFNNKLRDILLFMSYSL
jgi:NitT/TauT family transport system ATP-binding protein